MRLVIPFILLALVTVNFTPRVYGAEAQTSAGEEPDQPSESKAVNVGNKICPVSGEQISPDSKATYEYEGKIYNLCCPACIAEFKNNPEKYKRKVKEELQGNPMDRGGHMNEGPNP